MPTPTICGVALLSDEELLSMLAIIAKGDDVDLDSDALSSMCVELLARRREDHLGVSGRPDARH